MHTGSSLFQTPIL